MSVIALFLRNTNQIELNSKTKFLDDNLYDDDSLPYKFNFVNEVDKIEMEQAAKKGNAFISGVDSIKGFSQALDMIGDDR